jgi:hypothetical protein
MIKFLNSWQTTIQAGIDADDTTITIDSSHATELGTIAAGSHYLATITDSLDTPTKKEIVRITAVSGNALTATRAQDGTTGQVFASGAYILLDVTAEMLEGFVQGDTPEGDGDIVITDAAQTLTNKRLTSPRINEDVALTKTGTELNSMKTEEEIEAMMEAHFCF